MSIAKIKEVSENILNRRESVEGKGEEATKQAMVLPMLDALGYDICVELELRSATIPTARVRSSLRAVLGPSARASSD